MAKTRAQREAEFKARTGVSSGTYYAMRRQAKSRGINETTFDKLAKEAGYNNAKTLVAVTREDPKIGKAIEGLVDGAYRIPGSKDSSLRRKVLARLARLWRQQGGEFSKLLGALGSPLRKARVNSTLQTLA